MLEIAKTPHIETPSAIKAAAKIGARMTLIECDEHFKMLINEFGVVVLDYIYRRPV